MPHPDLKLEKKTVEDLTAFLHNEAVQAIGSYNGSGQITEQRREALERYMGEPYGNEIDGRSQVVSTDIQDTIESIMPDFCEIFAGTDRPGRFVPGSEKEVAMAEQITDAVNHVVYKENDWFFVVHDLVKDALLQKNGIAKVYWDDSDKVEKSTYTKVTSMGIQAFVDDPSVTIEEANPSEDTTPEEMQLTPDGFLYDVMIERRVNPSGSAKIEVIPPEEFLISRRATNDMDKAPFMAHRCKKTASDLVEMGWEWEEIMKIPSHTDASYNEERLARFDSEDQWPDQDDSLDPAMRQVWIWECYAKIDMDGDGRATWHQAWMAGPGHTVIDYEEVDDHPFEYITPIRMTHKFFGRSLADILDDVQLIKTTVTRQLLDNMYNVNNGRTVINERVNLDDMLTNRPEGVVRVEGAMNPSQAVMPLQTQSLGNFAYPLLEYLDGVREQRSGVTRYSQGLDADSLNKTATGVTAILGRTQKRMLLIARVFAEGGIKRIFRKVFKLLVQHQDRVKMIQLGNGEWQDVDPRYWNHNMDVTVEVGLGHGTTQERAAFMERLLGYQEKIIGLQGGVEGPLVTLTQVYNTLETMTDSLGIKNTGAHFQDPDTEAGKAAMQKIEQAKQSQQDPKMMEAQGKMQIEQMKAQADQQKVQMELQAERQKGEVDSQTRRMEMQMRMQGEQQKAQADAAVRRFEVEERMRLEREKAAADIQLQREKDAALVVLEREKAQAELSMRAQEAGLDRDIKLAEIEIKREDLAINREMKRANAGNGSAAAN